METIITQAVYQKGVLKPRKKLNLPEDSVVEIQVKTLGRQKQAAFASLIGIWQNLSDSEVAALGNGLKETRQQSGRKIAKLL